MGKGEDSSELCERPGEQPDTDREKESAGNGEERGEREESELDARAKEPSKGKDVRAPGNRTKGMTKTRESPTKTYGAALEQRSAKPGEKNGDGEDSEEEEG